jgi:hypothetical protein
MQLSHQPGRQQERHMRKFKSQGQAQRFIFCHGVVNNLFKLGRHLMKANNYRFIRDKSFIEWNRASYVQNLASVVKLPFNSSDPGNLTVPSLRFLGLVNFCRMVRCQRHLEKAMRVFEMSVYPCLTFIAQSMQLLNRSMFCQRWQ